MFEMLPPMVHTLIDSAIEEDLGRGDITTRLTIDPNAKGSGRLVAKRPLVVSGLDVFARVCERVDPEVEVAPRIAAGGVAAAGDVLATARGPVASLLMAERVALNFFQRLCGVATLTRDFVERLPEGCPTRITDTRKTTPGMRYLERRAVIHGGGHNHRLDLSGGVLIKENHVAAAGGIAAAVTACRAGAPHPLRVEVEVRGLSELLEAIDAGADVVLLDNMTTAQVARCVQIVAGRLFVEASGGVSLDTVADLAAAGVDAISVGALTHSAPAADISFLLESVTDAPPRS